MASKPTVFEMLFVRLHEIAAIMAECKDKDLSVKQIKERFTEFQDIPDNTLKTNITAFPFLVCEFDRQIQAFKSEKERLTQEIKRLNTVITNLYEDMESYEVNQVNDKPENEVNLNQVNDKPENEVNLNQVNDKPENEVNLNQVNDKPENEVNLNQVNDKPENEVNLNQVNDKPENEVNLNQVNDKPENEVNLNQVNDKPENEVNLNQVNDKPENEVNLNQVNDKPENEVNLNQVNDKPENEVNLNQVNELINEIIQRLERVEKAVFQSEVNRGNDKPENEVNINMVNQGNLFQVNEGNDKPKLKVGKWNIVERQGKRGVSSFRAYRNLGKEAGVKAVYIGNEFSEQIAREKIEKAGYPID